MTDLPIPPDGATAAYTGFQGSTWIKDLDLSNPDYPMAYVWSYTTKRWRAKRERIRMESVRELPK